MANTETHAAPSRMRASELDAYTETPADAVPRWESWMSFMSIACAIMFVAAWMPRSVAQWAVGAGLALAAIGTVQMLLAMRRAAN